MFLHPARTRYTPFASSLRYLLTVEMPIRAMHIVVIKDEHAPLDGMTPRSIIHARFFGSHFVWL